MGIREDRLNNFVGQIEAIPGMAIPMLETHLMMLKESPGIFISKLGAFRHFLGWPPDSYRPLLYILSTVAREVPAVRDPIIKEYGNDLYELQFLFIGQDLQLVKELIEACELPLSGNDEMYKAISRSCIALNKPLILIIGAGFSYDSMPITSEFDSLLIQCLKNIGVESPKKILHENEKEAWRKIKENQQRFKEAFSCYCATQKPSAQHDEIASLLRKGHIAHIISFNWDDLIERAYFELYKEPIPKIMDEDAVPDAPCLWKLHGDVQDISKEWVFPYEDGKVFKNLIPALDKTISGSQQQLDFSLIVGYRESEPVVRNKLISWIEEHVQTIRVRPDLDTTVIKGVAENTKSFFQKLNIYFGAEERKRSV